MFRSLDATSVFRWEDRTIWAECQSCCRTSTFSKTRDVRSILQYACEGCKLLMYYCEECVKTNRHQFMENKCLECFNKEHNSKFCHCGEHAFPEKWLA